VSERTRRIGLNEAVFRHVNEELEGLARTFTLQDGVLDLVCECGDALCVERIEVDRDAYERVRADSHLFLVFPGHVIPDVEDLVDRTGSYEVVRKREGEPAQIAEETDPRA
jgi:hypothetical protein